MSDMEITSERLGSVANRVVAKGFETIKHRAACAHLASLLKLNLARHGTNGRVFREYPICIDAEGAIHGAPGVWDEGVWKLQPPAGEYGSCWAPTYAQCIAGGLSPLFIHDVVLSHKGSVVAAYEVVFRGPPTDEKMALFNRVKSLYPVRFFAADEVISWSELPIDFDSPNQERGIG